MSYKRKSYNPSPLSSPKSNTSRHDITVTSSEYNNSDDYEVEDNVPTILNQLATFPLFKNAPTSFHKQVAANLRLIHTDRKSL